VSGTSFFAFYKRVLASPVASRKNGGVCFFRFSIFYDRVQKTEHLNLRAQDRTIM